MLSLHTHPLWSWTLEQIQGYDSRQGSHVQTDHVSINMQSHPGYFLNVCMCVIITVYNHYGVRVSGLYLSIASANCVGMLQVITGASRS